MATTSPPEAWFVNLRDSNNVDLGTNTVSDPAILTYTFNDLDKGSEYSVRVAGNNSRGNGDYSDFVSSQTIVDGEYCIAIVASVFITLQTLFPKLRSQPIIKLHAECVQTMWLDLGCALCIFWLQN